MKRCFLFLLALTTLSAASSASCFAQASCPWMNAATAGGFLGGEVRTIVSGVNVEGDSTCEFTHGDSMLRIAIHTMSHAPQDYAGYLALCGSTAVALTGIGNQAVRCVEDSGTNKGEELIVGRVRERAFVIAIKAGWITRSPTSPTKTRNPISDDSENIAEQVAGAMF